MIRRRVHRWNVAFLATLALTGAGLVFAAPVLLAGAVIPLTYGLYGALSTVPPEPSVTATRTVEPGAPMPGERVTVSLTVTNEGDSVLPDVRIVDGVPAEFAVTGGSARACVSLPPAGAVTLEYTVVARRGTYQFDDPVVRLRSLAGTEQVTTTAETVGTTEIACSNTVRDPPTRNVTLPRAGTQPTDTGGSGLAFYATRQYQPGDPLSRIDWNHVAKTGEFVTVQYRQERAIRTVIMVDARPVGRVTPEPGYPTGAELAAYAGERLSDALDKAGVSTSVTAVGLDDNVLKELTGPDGLPWVGPGSGSVSRHEVIFDAVQTAAGTSHDESPDSLSETAGRATPDNASRSGARATTQPDGNGVTPRGERTAQKVLERLPPNAQVVCCTPLLDDWPLEFARSLTARGYETLVVSPDVTGEQSQGQRIAALERQQRLTDLERTGAPTVSWRLDEPIDRALRTSLPHILSQQ